MAISDPGRGLVRCLGVTAAALFAFAAASQQRAEALSLASPGTAPSAKFATDGADDRSPAWRRWRWRWRFPRRWRRWLSGGGGGGFRGGGFHGGGFRGGGAAFHGGGFRGGGVAIHRGGGFRAAPVFRGGGMRYGYRHVYHRPHFHHRHHFHRRFYAPGYYGYPVLLWLPAPLLPRDLDLLRAAQDLPLSSVASSPLAPSLLRIPVPLLVRGENETGARSGACFLRCERTLAVQSQSLPAPGLDLPRRQRLHPPLLPNAPAANG